VDGVRVLLGCDYNDGIGGTVFVRGLSEPVAAPHADRLVAIFGHMGARIVPVDTVSPHGAAPVRVEAVEAVMPEAAPPPTAEPLPAPVTRPRLPRRL
jgi:hypothetical protein